MLARLNHTRLLRYAGLFTWAVVGLPLLYTWLSPIEVTGEYPEETLGLQPMALPGWASYLVFGLSYVWLTRSLGSRRTTALDLLGLLVLTGSAIAVSYYSVSGLGSVLLMTTACVLPWLLPLRAGVAWLVLSQFAVVPVFVRGFNFPLVDALLQSVLYAGFCVFVFVTSLVARQQAQAREEQRRLNAELRATRLLLAESARINERTRISRELHDLLGHHLTALSLNLEVAGHLSEGRVKEHVQQAHTLARLLLTDVREAVSQLRDDGAIDLSLALRPLAENVPSLDIHMEIEAPLTLDDPERAHVLLRCTQEIITNAVRHAGARNLWITARREGRMIAMDARDDGRGADTVASGNGLRGMRERLAQHGGDLQIETRPNAGFCLHLTLPASAVDVAS
ncbi:sensor histidine kinase [Lysobacter psychrotolerans]|uniref:Sensor histidine kinase n=1 Tax=Montanilutibacter psychrotolerans TaxID=1327343 RepID=A0A3M8SSS1_9GAMM|nr:sensor histidine kinase [Lysobacter psychrotolerans]RNF82536.1 sensor histidine kinase [Lysobacter psychrotolerans]